LKRHIGPSRRIVDIDDAVVAGIVAIRRGEPVRSGQNRTVKGKPAKALKPPRLVSPATVNRSVTEPLRKILNRAKRTWKEPVGDIAWGDHLLREPRERIREMRTEEEARIFSVLRPDYQPVIRFALLTGLRLGEIPRLRWQDVDWGGRQVTVHGKGGKIATVPLAPDVRELLWSLRSHHQEAVFTYVAAKAGKGRKRGERYPITRSGLQTTFRRVMPNADVLNYSFHDNRHTAATRVLRATGNLKIVQRLLRHDQITTTAKYAHALDEDVMAAMQLAAERATAAQAEHAARNPTENPTETAAKAKKVAI
jgi:integrase